MDSLSVSPSPSASAPTYPEGVMGLLRKLQSTDPSRVLEALRAIIAAARRNPRFAREFNKWVKRCSAVWAGR